VDERVHEHLGVQARLAALGQLPNQVRGRAPPFAVPVHFVGHVKLLFSGFRPRFLVLPGGNAPPRQNHFILSLSAAAPPAPQPRPRRVSAWARPVLGGKPLLRAGPSLSLTRPLGRGTLPPARHGTPAAPQPALAASSAAGAVPGVPLGTSSTLVHLNEQQRRA